MSLFSHKGGGGGFGIFGQDDEEADVELEASGASLGVCLSIKFLWSAMILGGAPGIGAGGADGRGGGGHGGQRIGGSN